MLQFSFKNASFYSFLTAYHDIIMKSDAFDHPELSKLEFVSITEEMYAEFIGNISFYAVGLWTVSTSV